MPDSPSTKKIRDTLLTGLLEGAVAAVALGVIAYLFGFLGGDWTNEQKAIAAGIVLLLVLALAFLLSLAKRTVFDTLGRNYMSERTGIATTYLNLEACKEDMQKDFEDATSVRLLLQIGRKELGYHEASFFYKLAKDKKDAGATVKILRASSDSPFLSEARARARGYDHYHWMEHIRRLGNEIEDLRRNNSKIHIEERLHHEPFLWRIFIFDDIAYISAYLVSKDVDLMCKVYRVKRVKEDSNSLYTVFEKYFDYLWHKYDPTDTRGPQERWASWK